MEFLVGSEFHRLVRSCKEIILFSDLAGFRIIIETTLIGIRSLQSGRIVSFENTF